MNGQDDAKIGKLDPDATDQNSSTCGKFALTETIGDGLALVAMRRQMPSAAVAAISLATAIGPIARVCARTVLRTCGKLQAILFVRVNLSPQGIGSNG